jgi:hypothetical protein
VLAKAIWQNPCVLVGFSSQPRGDGARLLGRIDLGDLCVPVVLLVPATIKRRQAKLYMIVKYPVGLGEVVSESAEKAPLATR